MSRGVMCVTGSDRKRWGGGGHMQTSDKAQTMQALKREWQTNTSHIFSPHMSRCLLLTCLERGRGVGGAPAVVRDRLHVNLVLLTTFEHGDLTASGGRWTVEGHAGAINGFGHVQVCPKNQIPSHCHHATGAAVVHRDCRHRVDGWRERVGKM